MSSCIGLTYISILLFSFPAMARVECATSLAEAINANNLKKVNRLLKGGANPNERAFCAPRLNSYGRSLKTGPTPLHYAITSPEMVRSLIKAGADVNAQIDYFEHNRAYVKYSVISWCIEKREFDTCKILLDAGANPNGASDEILDATTANGKDPAPLTLAIEQRSSVRTKLVVDYGAKVSFRHLLSALDTFIDSNSEDQLLNEILKKIDLNYLVDGETLLTYWIPRVRFDRFFSKKVDLLVNNGANVNARNSVGRTPLMLVGDSNQITTLIEKGADINAFDNLGKTAFMWNFEDRNCLAFIDDFIKNGANVNAKDNEGKTPLIHAVLSSSRTFCTMRPSTAYVNKLVKAGANINDADNNGTTALMYSATFKQDGINPETDYDFVLSILSNHADVNQKDSQGRSALFYAAEKTNDIIMAKILIRAGAKMGLRDNQGRLPSEVAKDQRMADFLKANGF